MCIFYSDGVDSDSESTSGVQLSLMDKEGVIDRRHHEYKSQIEENKIRDDAAIEEAKRKQIALQEEKILQERMKVEEAKRQAEKKKEEEAKAAALEAERAAKEAADVAAAERTVLKGAESALKLEERKLQMYNEVVGKDFDSKMASQREYRSHGMQMARRIKTITGSKENVRHHEYKSQIEENKIRDDAAIEEAKRKQIALQEEKIRQERMKVEEAKRQAEKKKEEEAKAAALEAERAAKEATDVAAAERTVLKGAESALKLEEIRLQMYNEVEYRSHGMQMARRIKTITGSKENIFFHSTNASSDSALYAYAHVIVMVTSQGIKEMSIRYNNVHVRRIGEIDKKVMYDARRRVLTTKHSGFSQKMRLRGPYKFGSFINASRRERNI
ncbi:GLE1-like protein [Artemisia annua]|uniref:GLE1-like protein n=1 Tax=Artemisia annua TaxID=35608 RepID=A0A2U1M050_ARTAN|nr:GLE1-like protein [Artemisia annua]